MSRAVVLEPKLSYYGLLCSNGVVLNAPVSPLIYLISLAYDLSLTVFMQDVIRLPVALS